MRSFLQRHAAHVWGALRGFDRIRFRGTFRQLATVQGMTSMLAYSKVLFKDFRSFAERVTDQFRDGVIAVAEAAGRPVQYLTTPEIDKEQLINDVARDQGVGPSGVLAVLSAVEVCNSFELHRNRLAKILELRTARRSACITTSIFKTRRSAGSTFDCRPGFRGTYTFCSMAANGWPGRWIIAACAIGGVTTASSGSRTLIAHNGCSTSNSAQLGRNV